MVRRFIFTLLLLASSNTPAQSPLPEGKERPCHQHPQLVGSCFRVRGLLSVYNGSPALRIWKVGTRRVLGISDQRFAKAGYKNVPDHVKSKLEKNAALFGNFLVCPFTYPKPREMQLVCIDSATHLVVSPPK
jgi:hypothetical protein